MASPKTVTFFVYDSGTGVPLAGQVGLLTFDTYKDDLGVNLAQPAFVEIGGGVYSFTPVMVIGRHVNYIINTGAGAAPDRLAGNIRYEDFSVEDDVSTTRKIQTGRWKIFIAGPDANRLVIYDDDDVTVLLKFDLFDSAGAATFVNPFQRTPV